MRTQTWLLPVLAAGGTLLAAAPALADPFDYGTPGIVSPLNMDEGRMAWNFSHRWGVITFPKAALPAFDMRIALPYRMEFDNIISTTQSLGIYEGEAGIRWQILDEYNRQWMSVTPHVGYDTLGNTFFGELTASKRITDWIGIAGVYRAFSTQGPLGASPGFSDGIGAGAMIQIQQGLSLMGDVFLFSNPLTGNAAPDFTLFQQQRVPFNLGIQWYVPDSPHVLMLTFGSSSRQSTMGRSYTNSIADYQIGFEYGTQFDIPFYGGKKETNDDEE